MEYTAQQTLERLTKLDKMLWKAVHDFCGKHKDGYTYKEDLHSVCVEYVLQHFKTATTEEEACCISKYGLLHVMCAFVVEQQPLSTTRGLCFQKAIAVQTQSYAAEYHDTNNDDIETIVSVVDYEVLWMRLNTKQREVLLLLLQGYCMQEIARMKGVNHNNIRRCRMSIQAVYMQTMAVVE